MSAALLAATTAGAQQGRPPGLEPEPEPVADPATVADAHVTTLGEVRAINPDDEPLDLYRFKNPMAPAANQFSRGWKEPPTPEQVSLSGGYLFMGINYALGKAAQGVHKLTGGRDQIQSAQARPPPLSEEQVRRAGRVCGDDCGAPDKEH